MNDDFELLRETFRAEAMELLADLESSLLELEKKPDSHETVSSIFRVFHTLKGSGAMCGFEEISGFTHEIETVYDLVRSGKIIPDKKLIDITLGAGDLIKQLLSSSGRGPGDLSGNAESILFSFREFIPGSRGQGASADSGTAATRNETPKKTLPRRRLVTFRIRFKSSEEIFRSGMNPVLLLNELRSLGECTVVAHTDALPDLYSMDPEACYTFWDAILTTDRGIDAIRDVFIFVESESLVKIDIIDDGEHSMGMEDYQRIGEILVEKRDISPEDLEKVLLTRKRLGDILIEKGLVVPETLEAALIEQEQLRQIRDNRQKMEAKSSVRVSSHKLDKLMNLVGEIVTVQARLSQVCTRRNDPDLLSIAEEVERLTEELRDTTMDVRMMPIGSTFSSLKRLVRDLSRELGKQVDLVTDGGETELDKTIIEKLHDPLVHLIRNSLDHGIEMPDVRKKNGKDRKGLIQLGAVHSGDHVVIEIMDDGKGLDPERIRAKAVRDGLVPPDSELAEKDIFNLILAPGFTTAEGVTSVSGRGVGMDVVKKAVDALRGTIHIYSSRGRGTTITLILPLTLVIIEGLLVRIGEASFVLPLASVEECIELSRWDIAKSHGRHITDVRGQVVPYIRLREHFMIGGACPDIEQIVIVNTEKHHLGLVVDSVIGGHQTVIKTLGRVFSDVRGISGATILGDGTVALIVDIEKLVQIAEEKSQKQTA